MERSSSTSDAPDVLRWTMVGHVTLADIERLFAEQLAFCRGKPSVYLIVDLSRMKDISVDARRAAARAPKMDGKPMPLVAIAIVGGSFQLRLLGKMINKASSVLNGIDVIPLDFFDSVQQARDWLETQKRINERKTKG